MRITAKADGVVAEYDLPVKGFMAVVHEQGIKIEVQDAVVICPKATQKCMEEISP